MEVMGPVEYALWNAGLGLTVSHSGYRNIASVDRIRGRSGIKHGDVVILYIQSRSNLDSNRFVTHDIWLLG